MIDRLLAILAITLWSTTAASSVWNTSIFEKNWVKAETDNLTVYSTMGTGKAENIARRLEIVRLAASFVLDTPIVDNPVPVTVVVLQHRSDFETLGFSWRTNGAYLQTLSDSFIVLHMVANDEAATATYKYAYSLMRNQGAALYPRWYLEGLANYFMLVEKIHDRLRTGIMPSNRRWIRWEQIAGPYRDSFTPKNEKTASIELVASTDTWPVRYYGAYAWVSRAFVHYLVHRKDASFKDEMTAYLRLRESGTNPHDAAVSAFELDNMREYPSLGTAGQVIKTLDIDRLTIHPRTSKPTALEIAGLVGNIALATGAVDLAETAFRRMLDDEYPFSKAKLGRVASVQGDLDQAEWHLERAVQLGPEDPRVHLEAGRFWRDRALSGEYIVGRAESIERSKQALMKSWKLDSENAAVYALLGEHYLLFTDNFDRSVELLEIAESIMPSSGNIQTLLAEAYVRDNKLGSALRRIEIVSAWPDLEQSARKRIPRIVEMIRSKVSSESESLSKTAEPVE